MKSIVARGFIVFLLAVTIWAGPRRISYAAENIIIPFAGPLTGSYATFGLEALHGAMLAAEDIHATGGLQGGPWKGKQIEFETFDDRGDSTEAANIAQRLVTNPNYVVVIGHIFSSACLAALPIYEEAMLSMVTPVCSNPTITTLGYKTIIRLVQDDTVNATGQTDAAVNVLGGKKLGMLYANDDYGKGLADVGAARAKELGVDYVLVPYNEGETDYNAQINQLKRADVDVIVHFGNYTEAGLQRRQAVQQGLTIPFLGAAGAVSPEFIKLAGDAAEGAFVTDFISSSKPNQKLKELAQRVHEKFGEEWSLYHRNGYDTMMFIAAALQSAIEPTRQALNDALHKTEIDGLNYHIRLTDTGNLYIPMDRIKDFYQVKIVQNGAFVDYVK